MLVGLLDVAAAKLWRMAETLSQPGNHARDRGIQELLDASDKLRTVASAEGLEALLLRRPRPEMKQRQAALAKITRCLLYADQFVPLLQGADTEIANLLRGLGASICEVAAAIRRGASPPILPNPASEFGERFTAAYRAGRISLVQLQASLRLVETLAGLTEAVDRLATSAPEPASGLRGAGLRAVRH